jgi:hypothetical protein
MLGSLREEAMIAVIGTFGLIAAVLASESPAPQPSYGGKLSDIARGRGRGLGSTAGFAAPILIGLPALIMISGGAAVLLAVPLIGGGGIGGLYVGDQAETGVMIGKTNRNIRQVNRRLEQLDSTEPGSPERERVVRALERDATQLDRILKGLRTRLHRRISSKRDEDLERSIEAVSSALNRLSRVGADSRVSA